MPGTVVAIDKKTGDAVEQGDKIMTIEAMKMENEIRAEKSGKIKEIRVSVGSSVLAKEVLAVIE
jgi:biotin carboxyl carrier protein